MWDGWMDGRELVGWAASGYGRHEDLGNRTGQDSSETLGTYDGALGKVCTVLCTRKKKTRDRQGNVE